MKKSLFIMALGAIALTSCSQDEIIEVKKDAISFAVATENASRATATTAATLENFVVYANENGQGGLPYLTGVTASKTETGGGAGVFQLASTYYWPIKALDFYCISPAVPTGTIAVSANVPSLSTYTVDSDHAEDLLYSVSMNTAKGDGVADINFRHALSMIQFNIASDATYGLDVEVSEIQICNIDKTGAYALPSTTTSPNLDANPDLDASTVTRGVWSDNNTQVSNYKWGDYENASLGLASTDNVETAGTDETKSIVYFVLPQTVTPASPANWENTYFKIYCLLKKDGVAVHNGYVAVPATAPADAWKEGNKYIYTLTFGKGGGYIPDTENPAIIPISFDITVDEMQDAEQGVAVQVP